MILSAQFANAAGTAVTIITDDRGAIAISAADRPVLWAQYQAWPGVTAAFVPADLSAIDQTELNRALAQDGSVLRALAAVMLSEVNILRTNAGLSPRTQPQFVAAHKAQMRT